MEEIPCSSFLFIMNNITSIFLSHPKDFMRIINRLRREALQPIITDEKEFLNIMLSKADEKIIYKMDEYSIYVVYEYEDEGSTKVESAIIKTDKYPNSIECTEYIIYTIKEKYNNAVILNMITLED